MALTSGIDVACRAAHQSTLARDGLVVWRGRKFTTRSAELDKLLSDPLRPEWGTGACGAFMVRAQAVG